MSNLQLTFNHLIQANSLGGLLVATACAGEAPQEAQTKSDTLRHWKATTGWYHFSNDANAWDFNLRYTWKDIGNFWVGHYLPIRSQDARRFYRVLPAL